MDIRAVIVGILAAIALIGAIVLAALGRDALTVASLIGVATTFGGYVIGLYSSAYDGPTGVVFEPVDEPASVVRAGELGRADGFGIVALVITLAWVALVAYVLGVLVG